MAETRRKFHQEFREGAVRLVRETGKPIAQARNLGINEGTPGNWVNADKRRCGEGDGALSEDERAELARLRKERRAGEATGWDSSPGPADYESTRPAAMVTVLDLGGHVRVRSWFSRFGHALGTIKLYAARFR